MRARRITPAQANVPVATEGSFERDGQYPGEPFTNAGQVRMWGSWSGSDDNVGTISIGPFPAPRMLRIGVGGYPDHDGNTLRVELADQSHSIPIRHAGVGERWEIVDVELSSTWEGRAIRIVGRDSAGGIAGWFAVSEPLRGARSDGNNALIETLAAFAINGLLLGLVYGAAAQSLCRLTGRNLTGAVNNENAAEAPRAPALCSIAPHWIPLAAGAVVAGCGYAVFWAYFAHALLGVVFSCLIFTAAAWMLARDHRTRRDFALNRTSTREVTNVLALMVSIGAFYLGLLHLFPTSHDFYTLAANRYREALPSDNVLPHTTAERLFASESLKNPVDEWRSSDRPPLQAGWQLLTWPASKVLGLDRRTASGTSAVWFQLLWIAAAYGLFRTFAVGPRQAAGWIAALALCGFFLQNTTYTWPKLSAGVFACGAFAVLVLPSPGSSSRTNGLWSAVFAGLGWLSHGGVAFSFIPLLPWLAWRAIRGEWRPWLPGAAAFLMLVLPWLAYQKLYDPPGDMLLKLHLAGENEKKSGGTLELMRANYERLGWSEAWANKVSNFHGQVIGHWPYLLDVSSKTRVERRNEEFFHVGRALTWWPVLALFALVITRRRIFAPPRNLAVLAGWLLLTIIIWCLLMFGRYQAVIHHGSYAVMIGLFVFFSVVLERSGRGWLGIIALLQGVTLGTTWAIGNPVINGPVTGLPFALAAGAGVAFFLVRAFIVAEPEVASLPSHGAHPVCTGVAASTPAPRLERRCHAGPAETFPDIWQRGCDALSAWWANPRLNPGVLAVFAFLLFLRKPHALHTPQLWAEDGSIFLMQADLHGLGALIMPYMGYLHTLPRLIAAVAPPLLDPAWWPEFYNGLSFAIWLAVLARLFTSRFILPGKPWLAFALIAVPHTGEVFFNITNLQWLTAFVLIQQVLITPPRTAGERVGDLTILALVCLTGPFGIIFLPLFVWRWARDRRKDNAAALVVVLLAAALQAWFVMQTRPRFEFQSEPVRFWTILEVLARRVVVWPALGQDIALAMPPTLVAVIGGTLIAAVIGWAVRPHPRRLLRAQVVAAFALITVAAVYRTRPDTWAADNLDFGDRYFYIPRVLLAWLLIWEFDSRPRILANAARVFCTLVLVMHLRTYTVRAPIDYHWDMHVQPIRQGVPADIPTLPEGWSLEYRGRPAK